MLVSQLNRLSIGIASLKQSENIRSRLRIILNPRRLKDLFLEKVTDINAAPAALSSVVILTGIQIYNEGVDSLWSSEFHIDAIFVTILEFALVFKGIKSGREFFSNTHLKAMQDLSRIAFGASLSTQVINSLREHGSLEEINWGRVLFEAGMFLPFVSLTTTKVVINFMVNPFSSFLTKFEYLSQNEKGRRELATFLLMLVKNAIGNRFYLYSTDHLFNNKREDKQEKL